MVVAIARVLYRSNSNSVFKTAAGDGRDNADSVSVFRRRILFRQIADILIVEIDIHERAQLAIFRIKMLAQFFELAGEPAKRFANRRRGKLSGIALPRVNPQRRRNHHFNGHLWFSPRLRARYFAALTFSGKIFSSKYPDRSSFNCHEVISCGTPVCTLTMM